MLEMIINPKRAERKPWEMAIIGFVYASLSVLLSYFIFSGHPVLSQYSGVFIVMFCVIFSMPFVYYTLKVEEKKDLNKEENIGLIKEHSKAIWTFLWLFVGYILAFSLAYTVFPNGEQFFSAQIQTYCYMNRPYNYEECANQYGISLEKITGKASLSSIAKVAEIFSNNISVLIVTLILSLIVGAGAIFVLAWNASVIAAAIGIFTKSDVSNLHLGLLRYLIHGLPEVAAYFVAALAGGILGVAVIRGDINTEKRWNIFEDVLLLVIIAMIILIISALIEVFITPQLF